MSLSDQVRVQISLTVWVALEKNLSNPNLHACNLTDLERGEMTVSSCEKLIETYPHRLKTVMFFKGASTKY